MFSVVIPLFEKRGFIQRSLDSVYAQTLSARLVPEIIVVNDGSTDGGDLIAKSQSDPRVRVIDQPNGGQCVARDAGIAAAAQPFIAFLDADDRWLPGYLARIAEMIAAFPNASIYATGYHTVVDGARTRSFGVSPAALAGRPYGPVDFFREWSRGHIIHTSSTVLSKAAVVAVGGFGTSRACGQDSLMNSKLALRGDVVLCPEPLAEYDVAVPGQMVEYFRTAHRQRFDVLEYQQFLAAELHRQVAAGSIDASLVAFCRKDYGMALLQRLYWGDGAAMRSFGDVLGLSGLPLGPVVAGCLSVARSPVLSRIVHLPVAVVRACREAWKRR